MARCLGLLHIPLLNTSLEPNQKSLQGTSGISHPASIPPLYCLGPLSWSVTGPAFVSNFRTDHPSRHHARSQINRSRLIDSTRFPLSGALGGLVPLHLRQSLQSLRILLFKLENCTNPSLFGAYFGKRCWEQSRRQRRS
jgi:hypothetical protein